LNLEACCCGRRASNPTGHGVDGLLGMSFLGRFVVAIGDREIQLKARTLAE
jgi:hypothetical protein